MAVGLVRRSGQRLVRVTAECRWHAQVAGWRIAPTQLTRMSKQQESTCQLLGKSSRELPAV